MKTAVDINWGRISPDAAVTEFVDEQVGRLESLFDRIHSCQISLDSVRPIRSRFGEFQVTVRVLVPRRELVVKNVGRYDSTASVFPVLSNSFNAMARKVRNYKQTLRHDGDRESIRRLVPEMADVA